LGLPLLGSPLGSDTPHTPSTSFERQPMFPNERSGMPRVGVRRVESLGTIVNDFTGHMSGFSVLGAIRAATTALSGCFVVR
jgi:hypothetical protein